MFAEFLRSMPPQQLESFTLFILTLCLILGVSILWSIVTMLWRVPRMIGAKADYYRSKADYFNACKDRIEAANKERVERAKTKKTN